MGREVLVSGMTSVCRNTVTAVEARLYKAGKSEGESEERKRNRVEVKVEQRGRGWFMER